MIPRQLDLTPHIETPLHTRVTDIEHALQRQSRLTRRVHIERWTLLPHTDESTHHSTQPQQLQLYSFVPTLECAVAPSLLRVVPSDDDDETTSPNGSHANAHSPDSPFTHTLSFPHKQSDPDEETEEEGVGNGRQSRRNVSDGHSNSTGTANITLDAQHSRNKSHRRGVDSSHRRGGLNAQSTRTHYLAPASPLSTSSASSPKAGSTMLRYSSVPIPEYGHLRCLLVYPPTQGTHASRTMPMNNSDGDTDSNDATDKHAQNDSGTRLGGVGERDSDPGNVVLSVPGSCPVMMLPGVVQELRCDRAERPLSERGDGSSISHSWLTKPSRRFDKSDWKSMDAMDRDAAKARNRWELDEATAASTEEADSDATHIGRPRGGGGGAAAAAEGTLDSNRHNLGRHVSSASAKRARKEVAGSVSVVTCARDRVEQALLNRMPTSIFGARQDERAVGKENGTCALHTTATRQASAAVTTQRGMSVRQNEQQQQQQQQRRPEMTSTRATTGTGMPAPLPRSARSNAQAVDTSSGTTITAVKTGAGSTELSSPSLLPNATAALAQPASAATLVSLPDSGAAVLSELRGQHRGMATLKELEKLVLKRVIGYTQMAEKAKSKTGKSEAVRWFREQQSALRQWLLERGHTIDASGNVVFA